MISYIIMKRRGAHVERMTDAPIFDDLIDAEDWAAIYLEGDPAFFEKDLDSIEVHRQERAEVRRPAASVRRSACG